MPRTKSSQRRSLFILSLPRSLSSRVYHAVREALDLAQPAWTSDGEILNYERSVFHTGIGGAAKFTREEKIDRFLRIQAFLAQVTAAHGFIYKDVVQPFAAARWLAGQDFPVLKLHRRVEDVAYAMIARRWFYPADAFPGESVTGAMLHGLRRAWDAIESVPGETVDFEDLITREEVLGEALRSLYPGATLRLRSLRGPGFERKREEVLNRRQTPLYQDLLRQARELGASPG
jgi:hypothetical protein